MKRYKLTKKEIFVSLQEFKEVPTSNVILRGGQCTFLFLSKEIKYSLGYLCSKAEAQMTNTVQIINGIILL